jgi:hypothetical protein
MLQNEQVGVLNTITRGWVSVIVVLHRKVRYLVLIYLFNIFYQQWTDIFLEHGFADLACPGVADGAGAIDHV